MPNGIDGRNGAPNAAVSGYLYRLDHCHQPLHMRPLGGLHRFYMSLHDISHYHRYCVLEGQPRSLFISLSTHSSSE